MKPEERRLSTRKTLKDLSYVSLPADNGGIVLDVSEGGLGFHAIAPIQSAGPIEFRFTIDSATRITAMGELAWRDFTGKTGGLRFTQLPDEIREKIRIWAGQSAAGTTPNVALPAAVKSIDVPVAEPRVAAEMTSPVEAQRAGDLGALAAGSVVTTALALMEKLETSAPARAALAAAAAAAEPAAAPRSSGAPAARAIPNATFAAEAESSPARRTEKRTDEGAGTVARAREAIASSTSRRSSSPVESSGVPPRFASRVPVFGAQANKLSMFGQDCKPSTKSNVVPVTPSRAIQHPFTAVVLTIALAFLVSVGIFSYLFQTRAGDALMRWGQAIWGGADPQDISEVPASPASTQDSSSQPR
jgi:PilZ domain